MGAIFKGKGVSFYLTVIFGILFLSSAQAKFVDLIEPNPEASSANLEAGNSNIFSDDSKFTCSVKEINCFRQLYEEHQGDGSKMALLINGEDSLVARLSMLKNAKQSVRIEALEFLGDDTGWYFAEKLKALKREKPNVDIRVIVDAMSNRDASSISMYDDLIQAGISVVGAAHAEHNENSELIFDFVTKPFNINRRFHEKMWLIDAEDPTNGAGIVGGMNIGDGYMRIGQKPFRDQDIYLKGPILQDIVKAFEGNYKYHQSLKAKAKSGIHELILKALDFFMKGTKKSSFVLNPENQNTIELANNKTLPFIDNDQLLEPVDILFIQNKPRFRETFIPQAYIRLINLMAAKADRDKTSKHKILIANAYFIPTKNLVTAISNAVLKGVKIKVLTNGPSTVEPQSVGFVSRYHFLTLISLNQDPNKDPRGSFEVYEWGKTKDPTFNEGMLHEKIGIFDKERVVIGSYNLDPRSENLNSEVVVAFKNAKLASVLADQFAVDIGRSTLVSLEDAQNYREMHGGVFKKFSFEISKVIGKTMY